jgi:CMP-N-acetylneuraminic acid synthetase
MKHFAVIPVKHHSERVENKNFRPFLDDKSLLDLKVEQLQKSGVYTDIFISSDSGRAGDCAKKYGIQLLERSRRFCDNLTPWSEVIVEVISKLPIEDSDAVSWCHVTSPLFYDFAHAASKFDALSDASVPKYNGLFAVARLNRFLLNSKYRPVNYAWGQWHPYSQDLEPYYFVTGSLFMARKRDFLDARYVITSRPYALEVSEKEAVDVDTELDFKIASMLVKEK